MYYILQKFHSGLAYIALLLLLIAVVNALVGVFSKKEFTSRDRKISLFGMLTTHIMLLVGLILYFVSPIGFAVLGEMKNASLRLTSLEHPLTNIIAITLITIGWSRHKKALSSEKKFKSIAIFFGIGLLLILSKIPWSLWF
jgi:NADH:ubiquinone oxidoreductase subunit 2 (subunit N)